MRWILIPSEGLKNSAKPYSLNFVPAALGEWRALDGSVKEVFRKLLKKRLIEPRVPGSELKGERTNCYKIKLRKQEYRLIYAVDDGLLVVLVLAVDRREDAVAYRTAARRKPRSDTAS
ncbi:MAG: type II toxin-antitoxin system RelE family toxin [Rectinemataceae bacterium]